MVAENTGSWMPAELATVDRQRDPYPWFELMRDSAPIRYDDRRDTFDVFRYEDVSEVVTDYERFSRVGTSYIEGHMASRDPPLHTELRNGVSDYFRPRFLESYREQIAELSARLVDDALSGDGTLQFVDELAKPLPILVVADMLGVPGDRMETFREWSRTLASAPEEDSATARERVEAEQARALGEVEEFFAAELEKRETTPQNDLITAVLRMEQESDRIDRDNAIAQCGHLLIAGNVTTTEFLANAMWTFIEEDVIDGLLAGQLELESALEEVLRYRSPVMPGKRYAREDTQIAGVDIHEGARVMAWLSSANRDERAFHDPGKFVPDRDPSSPPMAFGKGIHHCLGAPLARMEATILLSTLFSRIEGARMDDGSIQPFYSPEVYGPAELPLHITR
jgi:cytochrome P450